MVHNPDAFSTRASLFSLPVIKTVWRGSALHVFSNQTSQTIPSAKSNIDPAVSRICIPQKLLIKFMIYPHSFLRRCKSLSL